VRKIETTEDQIYLYTDYSEKQIAGSLPGARWTPAKKCWRVPATPAVAETLPPDWVEHYGDDNLRWLIHQADKRHKTVNSDDNTIDFDYVLKPWEHQIKGVKCLREMDVAVLNAWMSAGKTCMVFNALRAIGARRSFVVCPSSVIQVWVNESKKHCYSGEFNMVPLKGSEMSVKKRAEAVVNADEPFIAVINYEAMWRKPMNKVMLGEKWDALVFDEIHRLASPSSKQSKFAAKIKANKKWGLTGTLMPNSPLQVYAQYRALDKGIFGTSYSRFKRRYADIYKLPNGGEIVNSYRNLPELRKNVDRICYHIPKEALSLPELTTTERYCTLSREAAKVYKELNLTFISEVKEGIVTASNALAKLIRLQQVSSGFVHTEDDEEHVIGHHKENLLKEVIEDMGKDKVVVFARFRRDLDAIARVCKDLEMRSGEISGKCNDYDEWTAGNLDALAVQVQAGKEGIDLTQSEYLVFYSLSYSLGDYQQAIARVHKKTQVNHVHCIRLIAEGTIDEKIVKALDGKREIVDYILEELGG